MSGWQGQPADDPYHLRKSSSTSIGEVGQAGDPKSDLSGCLRPAHMTLSTFGVERRIELLCVKPQRLARGNRRQPTVDRLRLWKTWNETLWCSIEPTEHLQNAVTLGDGPGAGAHHRGWAEPMTGRLPRLPIDLARRLGPGQPARAPLRIKRRVKRPKAEVT
jgi:hypothetical protein